MKEKETEQPREKKARYEIVIARYKETLDWVSLLPSIEQRNFKLTISNSGEDIIVPNANRIVRIENLKQGREANHFLSFMENSYDDLLDVTVFLQANPWSHAKSEQSVTSLLNLFYGNPEFKFKMSFLGRKDKCYNFKTPKWTEVDFVIKSGWTDKEMPPIKENLPSHSADTAGQFYIKKEIIQKQKPSHYSRIRKCAEDPDSKLAYILEYYWPNVFDLSEQE